MAEGRSGVQPWLGVFFKYALGTSERRYLALAAGLERFCREALEARSRQLDGHAASLRPTVSSRR